MTCECGSWVSHQNGALRAPWGKEPYPPAAGGAMVRCAPHEGWDSVLPKESRPSLSCGLSASTWSLSSFQWTDFPDSFNSLSIHVSEFRGFRDGEIRRRAKCAHGRHGGVGHARCIDCPWSADVSRGNRRPCGRESERQRAGGRICCSRSLPGASGAGQRIADSTGPPAYVTRGCVLGEGP